MWSWSLLTVGVLARIVVPFLMERRENPSLSWDWKYVWPQIISFVIIALMLPVIVPNLESIADLDYQAAFLVGWAAGDIGNVGRKFLTKT
jgi:hypothetical protein